MLKEKRFLIGGLIVVLAIGYLAFVGYQRSATYYYDVSEIVAQGSSAYGGGNVKVNGQVATGSVVQAGQSLRFSLTEGGQTLPVLYQGAVPDTFKDGIDVVVEGRLNPTGIFQANTILTKCPSKYVAQ